MAVTGYPEGKRWPRRFGVVVGAPRGCAHTGFRNGLPRGQATPLCFTTGLVAVAKLEVPFLEYAVGRASASHSVGSYSLQLHSYRILAPQLSAHLHSIKHFSEKLHVLQSAVIFKNLDTLRSCFSVQALCFCIVFLDHVKYLQIHATSATSTLADWHTQKIHACSEVGCRPSTLYYSHE